MEICRRDDEDCNDFASLSVVAGRGRRHPKFCGCGGATGAALRRGLRRVAAAAAVLTKAVLVGRRASALGPFAFAPSENLPLA